MILLDTCTLLWLASDLAELSPHAKELIIENSDSLYISSISAFEIALKAQKKKLTLPFKPYPWFQKALEFHGIEEINLDASILIRAAELPPLHQDPCDRMIIATAQLYDFKLLTPDPLIQQYSNLKVEW